jgi:DNA-directed RNA polymerase subunit RPC12/RpoP
VALISCLECAKEISDTALTCPNCGATVNLVGKAKSFLKWGFKTAAMVWGVLIIIAIVILTSVIYLT